MGQLKWAHVHILFIAVILSACHPDPRPQVIEEVEEIADSLIIEPGKDTTFIPEDTSIVRNTDQNLFRSARFTDVNLFTESQLMVEKGQYWQANDFIGRPIKLEYTFRAAANDTMQARPFVLLLHEGAFLFGSRENEDNKAKLLARKGYATATIDYRIGFNGATEKLVCNGNNLEVYQALYRSVQDIYVALHYFMDNSKKFGIDPRNVIIGGSSAGGMAASAFLYMTEDDFEKLSPGIVKTLGHLDPYPNHTGFKVRSLLTYLGFAIIQSNYISKQNGVPTLFFQRTGDNVLAYEKGNLYFCLNYFATEGAKYASKRLQSLQLPYELNYEPLVGHHLSYSEDYITSRYALFVKRLWGGDKRQIVNENYSNIQNVKVN